MAAAGSGSPDSALLISEPALASDSAGYAPDSFFRAALHLLRGELAGGRGAAGRSGPLLALVREHRRRRVAGRGGAARRGRLGARLVGESSSSLARVQPQAGRTTPARWVVACSRSGVTRSRPPPEWRIRCGPPSRAADRDRRGGARVAAPCARAGLPAGSGQRHARRGCRTGAGPGSEPRSAGRARGPPARGDDGRAHQSVPGVGASARARQPPERRRGVPRRGAARRALCRRRASGR